MPAALLPLALVVEDERVVAMVICRHLDLAGYRCLLFGSGAQAMEVVEAGVMPDVMILDIRLPGLQGPEIALRVHQRHPNIPVLFTSGWTNGLTDSTALGTARWEFLPKPFDGEALVSAVRRLADH